VAGDRPFGREGVEVVGGGQLGRLDGELGGCPTDDDGEVVRGHAAVPSVCIFSKIHGSSVASLSSALVSW